MMDMSFLLMSSTLNAPASYDCAACFIRPSFQEAYQILQGLRCEMGGICPPVKISNASYASVAIPEPAASPDRPDIIEMTFTSATADREPHGGRGPHGEGHMEGLIGSKEPEKLASISDAVVDVNAVVISSVDNGYGEGSGTGGTSAFMSDIMLVSSEDSYFK